MNKDKEIIKLAQFLHNRYCNEDACCKDINECKICNCTSKALAEVLYKEGYRKVPDGAVILTPEERDKELKACNEKQAELEAEIAREKANYYNQGVIDGREDFEHLKQRNKELYEEIKLFTSNMKVVLEIEKRNAVKEVVEKLKAKAHSVVGFNVHKKVYAKEYTINEIDIDEILKEFTE